MEQLYQITILGRLPFIPFIVYLSLIFYLFRTVDPIREQRLFEAQRDLRPLKRDPDSVMMGNGHSDLQVAKYFIYAYVWRSLMFVKFYSVRRASSSHSMEKAIS